MRKIDLKCQNCGAMMHVSDDKTEVVCPYCKNKFLLSTDDDIFELAKKEEQLSYARKSGERKAIEESEKRQKKHKFFSKIRILLIIILIFMGCFLINYFSLEEMKDPFSCISVEFVGVDGKGKAKLIDNKSCEYYSDIEYSFSKENDLKESETIYVFVSSDKYRFGISSKKYKVEGLSRYLYDLSNLTDASIEKVHNYSYNHLSSKAFGSTFSGEIVSLEPYKLFLLTDNESVNTLFDVYKTSIKTPTGNIYEKLVVAYYEDFLLLNSDELFSYSKLYHCGGVIKAGDPNAISALDKNYVGYIIGFESIEDFKAYLSEGNDGSFVIKEK